MPSKYSRRKRGSKTADRPGKPDGYPDFPLYAHPMGYWAKKIRGKLHYFGRWGRRVNGKMERLPSDGWQEALEVFKAQRDDLYAGRTPRAKSDGLTIKDLCNRFLTAKHRKVESGELSPRSFQEYKQTTDLLIKRFGTERLVDDLAADDFESLRADIAKRCGPVRLGNDVTRIKSVFKYALDNGLIERAVRFGSEFRKPDKSVMRRHRNASDRKLFTADEMRLMLDALEGKEVPVGTDEETGKLVKVRLQPDPQLRAAVLLGINAGAGNTDVANLLPKHLDLKGGWLNYPRGKTGIARRVPLWAPTVKALRTALAERPKPQSDADSACVFLTAEGRRVVRLGETSRTDHIGRQFSTLLRALGINGRRGLGFYSLRHTFATIGLQTGDRDAVKALMGHAEADMLSSYDETGPSDDRLRAVAQHVHDWLFVKQGGAA